jgi:hypothetical protein
VLRELIRLDMGMAIGAGLRKPGCMRDRRSEVVVTLKGILLCMSWRGAQRADLEESWAEAAENSGRRRAGYC